jgi:hypothetical protein
MVFLKGDPGRASAAGKRLAKVHLMWGLLSKVNTEFSDAETFFPTPVRVPRKSGCPMARRAADGYSPY